MIRYLITILLLFSFAANATTYYVSNAGSDANNGTSTGTSWQTISKVNGFTFSSGDSILFNRGDTWNEQLIVPRTYLYFGAYGTGIKPIITGFQTQTGFTQSGSVWSKTASTSVANQRCVLLNGSFAIKSRTPNSGYSTYTGSVGDSVLITALTGTPSWVGKELAVRSITWVIDVVKVTAQTGGTVTVYPKLYTSAHGFVNGYMLLNDSTLIDVAGEYSYDSASKRLGVFSTSTPTVQISIFDTLIKCKRGTTLDNLALTGGNQLIVKLDSLTTVKNCLIRYGGWDAIQGDGIRDVVIDNDSVMNIYNNATTYDWLIGGKTLTLTNNYFKNIGYVAGMGKNGDGTYMGFLGFPDTALIEYNRYDSVGYNVIHFGAAHNRVKHNYVTNFGITKQDEAGIYIFGAGNGDTIRGNIINNGLGNLLGAGGAISGNDISCGIYLDDNSIGVYVDSNTISNCKWASMFMHAAPSNGHVVKSNYFEDSIARPVLTSSSTGATWKYNIFYSRNSANDIAYWDNTQTAIDSNYYLRPTLITGAVRYGGTLYDISGFTTDTHRSSTPANADLTTLRGVLYINPTKVDSTISLPNGNSTTYVDVKGKLYTHSITLHPYQSILLFQSILNRVDGIYTNSLR